MLCRHPVTSIVLVAGILLAALGGQPALAQSSLHLALTPSQKPTDLMVAGEAFGAALGKLVGVPIRVTVASDYAAVVEALRNRTADLAFVHPAGYVLANREAKAMIVAKDQWHGNTSYTSRIYVRKESGLKTLEELRGKTIAFVDPSSTSGYVYPMVMLIEKGSSRTRTPRRSSRSSCSRGRTTRVSRRFSTATSTPSPRSTRRASST